VTRRILTVAVLVLFAVGAAACAGEDQSGSAVHRLSAWVKGTDFGEDIGTLTADNARIPKAVTKGTGTVHGVCATMLDDAESANGELPSPDVQITDWLSSAYSLEGDAANECYDAGSTNKKLVAKAEKAAAKAQALFSRALIRIESIDGRVPSTTTTTENGPISIFG
jgi:hypothetical protein